MKHKNIIITGASSGFGKAIAYQLHNTGHTVILGARRITKLQNIQKDLKERVHIFELDISKHQSIHAFSQFFLSLNINLNVLINNAGLALGKDQVKNNNIHEVETVMKTNFLGAYDMVQTFYSHLKHASCKKSPSHIINIGSIAGYQAYPNGSAYCASKFALKALTQSLRQETLKDHIKVSSLDPGLANTEFSTVRHKGDTTLADATYSNMTPLNAQDIAEVVDFMIARPAHVNLDQILIMPTQQANAHTVIRDGDMYQ